MGDLRDYRRDRLYVNRVVSPDGEGGLKPMHISLWDGYPDDGGRRIITLYDARLDYEWQREHAVNIAAMLDEYPTPGWVTVPEDKTAKGLTERIRDIHTPHDNTAYRHGAETSCTECAADWPCPTIQLIEEAQ